MTSVSAGANYQAIAAEYRVGDRVVPYGVNRDLAGRVNAVYPAIGMVDVEFPAGVKRYPVEDLQRLNNDGEPNPPHDMYVPGGAGTVSVPGGPVAPFKAASTAGDPSRVAQKFVKQALYWAERDRKYRASAEERTSGNFTCPKCKAAALRKAIYRRIEGQSEHLFGCPECMFLIGREALIGHEGV